ncbi:mesoderm induction early response protein 3 isoform X2 [Octodon degus]|uniref:Mesoderm induction early response protein 3 isoform X2 n=1 Tax=Octodon degus TaxID=10160 RepID=A0A6P3EIC8_OCTDE|nr:mesoderm induction early response protein 3 isoform X2 [Octodon degus]
MGLASGSRWSAAGAEDSRGVGLGGSGGRTRPWRVNPSRERGPRREWPGAAESSRGCATRGPRDEAAADAASRLLRVLLLRFVTCRAPESGSAWVASAGLVPGLRACALGPRRGGRGGQRGARGGPAAGRRRVSHFLAAAAERSTPPLCALLLKLPPSRLRDLTSSSLLSLPQASFGSSSPVGSLSSEDHDFDPTAEMLVHDYDDERTLEEEEMMDEGKNFSSEIEDLEKEGSMPLEDLLAFYGYESAIPVATNSSANSSPSELADELPDMTLDKEEIAKDLLSGDDEETQSSADDLTPSVTSHEASDFFPRPLRSNTTCDGDKESEVEDAEMDGGNSPEDLRKEIMIGLQYQAEIPPYLGEYDGSEKVYEHEDQLLWRPDVVLESKVKEYLVETSVRTGSEKVMDKISAGAHTRDNEQALYELLKCNHNIKEAVERYCCSGKAAQGMTAWTEEECRSFEHALMLYGKDFHLIQKNKVRTRTVAECVAFYYMWKKSERYDYFAQQTKFGKKRYNHHPGVTDYMDRLVDETEALGGPVSSSALASPRAEPLPDQQLSILNSFTASDLTALTNSVATVCNPTDVSCLDDSFPALGSAPRGQVNHVPVVTEELLTLPSNGENDCFNLFETGFYHSELNPMNMCSEESERPAKRLKMGITVPESFMSEVSVNNLGVDFGNHTHHIASAKVAVSVADFGSLSASEANGFISAHALHQHAALHSE